MRFGLSTHLYHDQRLNRDHLVEIAAHGFEAVEVFATRSHFDYHDRDAIASLAEWLGDTGLALHSIHAPIVESFVGGRWGETFSNARTEETQRTRSVREAEAALGIAKRVPAGYFIVHLGVPAAQDPQAGDNNREAARRSLEEISALAHAVGVRVAVEIIPNGLSGAGDLVELIEDDLELPGLGICLDFGHAFMMGDLVEAVEAISGHLLTTHVHDNGGRNDDHLVPFEGAIDWAAALTAMQKVGYDGAYVLEVANTSSPGTVLGKAARARDRFERILGAA